MNKLEEKFMDIIYSDCEHDSYCNKKECNVLGYTFCHVNLEQIKKSAELTTDVAIKFAEFLCGYPDKNRNMYGEMLHAKSKYDGADTTKNLFQIFINEYYGK